MSFEHSLKVVALEIRNPKDIPRKGLISGKLWVTLEIESY